jgi:hypothetical protein
VRTTPYWLVRVPSGFLSLGVPGVVGLKPRRTGGSISRRPDSLRSPTGGSASNNGSLRSRPLTPERLVTGVTADDGGQAQPAREIRR